MSGTAFSSFLGTSDMLSKHRTHHLDGEHAFRVAHRARNHPSAVALLAAALRRLTALARRRRRPFRAASRRAAADAHIAAARSVLRRIAGRAAALREPQPTNFAHTSPLSPAPASASLRRSSLSHRAAAHRRPMALHRRDTNNSALILFYVAFAPSRIHFFPAS
eukprot:CAMPEP_0185833604 /NCGR_PEP_ID=MMETSP1353-20130828/3190_1 /TAXON_ID=1077150 /ORGANISM="Erythrolobus australicus, Strain CCMP3124" /LENGTH=163 /DNA_ID=CAMNT_0028531915 /DNA_START=216 /DNA_END=706 /DNA_ORIENTATION=-